MTEKFICEALKPDTATMDTARMAAGGPGLPRMFLWRGQPLAIARVRREWRDTAPCRNGSGERYANKHWFELETEDGRVATVYFERRPRGKALSARWWLHTISSRA